MSKVILLNGSHPDYLINLRGQLIRDIVSSGHQVHVTSPDLSSEHSCTLRSMGCTPHKVALDRRSKNLLRDYKYYQNLKRVIASIKPDLVLGYTIKPNIWGGIAAKHAGVPSASLVTGLGYAFTGDTTVRRAAQYILQRLYRLATNSNHVVIFQNKDDALDFVDAGCLSDKKKIRLVAGSGVDLNHFHIEPLPDEPAFLLIARLIKSKGIMEYVESGLSLKNQKPHYRIMLAGFVEDGPDAIELDQITAWERQGLEYIGPLTDVRPTIKRASVYVLPSYREGTPRTVLEAMSMGRPIITTDVPGCRETVHDGLNGYLVKSHDKISLEQAMRKLGDAPELRRAMGHASREIAEKRFAIETVNRNMMDFLDL